MILPTFLFLIQKLIYYDADRLGSPIKMSSSTKLFSAIDDAALGKSSFKHSENYVERVARVRVIFIICVSPLD